MKLPTLLLFAAALGLSFSSTLDARRVPGSPLENAGVPTQLPRTAIPRHYAITITPDAERLRFGATAVIDLDLVKPTSKLVLNAVDLAIGSATLLRPDQGRALRAMVSGNPEAQTASFTFPHVVTPGRYRLELVYSGKIYSQPNGLFALDYRTKEGRDARSLFTHFEPAHARRFVPSWDEPAYKAKFELAARIPADEMAVSNMPAASSRPIGHGLKEVRFAPTPPMSTYLLFFGAGDLERVSRRSAGHDVGVVVSRGNGSEAQLALDAEARAIAYYDDYFGRPYALPKLDNVAGSGQSQFLEAMENWGAIFTFEYALLNDPGITSEAGRREIFATEAHEVAHMWFGDLVTMAWWDDLWLNEGFANWMASKATETLHPDWGADVDRVEDRESAMALDALNSTHPIVQQVRTVEQANQAFDRIAYEKGESIIAMLEDFAGADQWQKGIRRYIRDHAYRNTRTSDLWTAEEAAGARGLGAIAADFTLQPGVPLIEVGPARCENGSTLTTLTQSQFYANRSAELSAPPLSWHVPVRASAGGAAGLVVTAGAPTRLVVPGCGPLILNPGQAGYFRTLYTPEETQALVGELGKLAPHDQLGLVENAWALSVGGYQPMAAALDFLAAVPPSSNAKVTDDALTRWDQLYDRLEGNPQAQAAIAARIIRAYRPRLLQLGFTPREGESAADAMLRPRLIELIGKYRDPAVLAEASRLFAAWKVNGDAIAGSLKSTWLGVIAANADAPTWDAIHERAQVTASTVERASLYQLLGAAADEALARKALDLSLTAEPGKTTSATMLTAVGSSHPRLATDFVVAHLSQVNQLVEISARSKFLLRLSRTSRDPSLIPILERYGNENLAESDRRPIRLAVDHILSESSAAGRIRSETVAWLQSHP